MPIRPLSMLAAFCLMGSASLTYAADKPSDPEIAHIAYTAGPREKSLTASIYAKTKLVFNRHVTNDLNFRVFEAMACGRVLLTDAQLNGQYELFEDGKHYVLYKDERDLEEQILRYLRDDGARERILEYSVSSHPGSCVRAVFSAELISLTHVESL